MNSDVRVVDIRLALPVSGDTDLVFLQGDLASKIRRARSVDYEERKQGGSRAPLHIVYALDRRVDWASVPELLQAAIQQLKSEASYKRNPKSYQWVLFSEAYNIKAVQTYVPANADENLDGSGIISLACKADMESMLTDDSVFFHHDRQAFFRLPSGEMSDYFLRVGNLQREQKNIERIAFWALPHISDVHHILCETWSISTTAAMIAQFIERYDSSRAVTWSYFSTYLPRNISDIQHLNELLSRSSTRESKLLFLVSATASGRIHEEYLKLARQANAVDRTKILTVYKLTDKPCEGDVIHDLPEFLQGLGLRGTTVAAEIGSAPVIEIDESTYIPRYRGATTKPFSVIKQTKRAREFFERYSGNNIFSIARKGRTSKRTPGRHYTYHVDVQKLMRHPTFYARFREEISKKAPVNVLVYTPSEANRQFLEIFLEVHKEVFKGAPEHVVGLDRLTLIAQNDVVLAALCDPEQHVVFLESLLVEGANLNDLEQTIREVRDKGFPSKSFVTYFVGLFRPYSKAKERWIHYFPQCSNHKGFSEKASLTPVETVILPKWSEDDCPWKRELRAHVRALDNSDLDERQKIYVQRRILCLSEAMKAGGDGLRGSSLFFKRAPSDIFPFWSGSFWLDKSAVVAANAEHGITIAEDDVDGADLICAVACAIHTWRFENPTSSLFIHDLSFDDVINQEVTSENAGFNEPMLRAAIWRALKPSEISVTGSNSDTESMLAGIFLDLNAANVHRVLGGEAALAYAWRLRGLLGPERAGDVDWPYLLTLADSVSDG